MSTLLSRQYCYHDAMFVLSALLCLSHQYYYRVSIYVMSVVLSCQHVSCRYCYHVNTCHVSTAIMSTHVMSVLLSCQHVSCQYCYHVITCHVSTAIMSTRVMSVLHIYIYIYVSTIYIYIHIYIYTYIYIYIKHLKSHCKIQVIQESTEYCNVYLCDKSEWCSVNFYAMNQDVTYLARCVKSYFLPVGLM